jgi:hypothetical protein
MSQPAETPPPRDPPVQPVAYASPGLSDEPPLTDTQRVFDTVAGPNVRLRDNLIQLACVVAGGGAGALVAGFFAGNVAQRMPFMLVGAVIGAVLALVVSGAVIGIIRAMKALRSK